MIKRLHRDEAGTAMTEFVMFLPIFIVVFAGLMQLQQIGNQAVAHPVKANQKLWRATFDAEDEAARMTPRGQFAQAFSQQEQNILSRINAAANATGGHWTESYSRTKVVMPALTAMRLPQPWRRRATMEPRDIIGTSTVSKGLVDDALTMSDFQMQGDLMGTIISGALQLLGATAGYAANIRYGDATHDPQIDEFTVAGVTTRLETTYTCRVAPANGPPFSDPFNSAEGRSYLVSRLIAETENPYSALMDFVNQRLNRRARYRGIPRWR